MTKPNHGSHAAHLPGHPDNRTPGNRGRVFVAVALAGLLVVGGGAYLTKTRAGDDALAARSSGALAPVDAPDPGVVHVHGLGVNPADGVLYAATHSGVFRLPANGGEARRVANRYQDTMGFTVVGPDTFLGSGHPDFSEGHPPRLGLIESSDAGETWRPLSLRGEADFHALVAAHGNVYGYESGTGTFMVSANRKDWDTRSQLSMRDFAVSPTDAGTVLATTARGLVRSTDGGRTWAGVAAPALAVLAWDSAGSLYGIAPDGAVHHSADGGATWLQRGTAGGAPEAVTFDKNGGSQGTLYVAVAKRGIMQSTDGGRTFAVRFAK